MTTRLTRTQIKELKNLRQGALNEADRWGRIYIQSDKRNKAALAKVQEEVAFANRVARRLQAAGVELTQ